MKEAFVLLLWWVLFAGTHVVLSSSLVRPKLIAAVGERPFLGLYSLVAFATLIPLCWSYARHKHADPLLWRTFGGPALYLLARDLNLILMALAFVLLVHGLVSRPPSAMMTSGTPTACGITRITRHPTFAAIFLFGVAHCLVNGSLSDLIFFGGFAVFSWLGARHQDTRKVAAIPGYAEFQDATSFLPFAAVMQGKQPLSLGELRWQVTLLALVLFYLVRAYHPSLFGGVLMTL
ncbi:MAG TPA: NnrU family protein [Candidatus Binatia bacterium]|nr:NnrU family protein [Candidatus Binatia bacterium]